jgi:hypothetical protein
MNRTLYHQGLLDAGIAHKLGQLAALLAQAEQFLARRYTTPTFLRTHFQGVRAHSPGETSEATKQQTLTSNTMSLETAIQNLADAIQNSADVINSLAKAGVTAPASNITPIRAGKPAAAASAAAASTPAVTAGAKAETPQAAGLRKAREAKAAQKLKEEEEAAAAAQAAAEAEEDTSLLDGTGETGTTVTLEDLRALGMQILKLKRQPQMKDLLESLGASSITTLTEENYEAAQEGLQAIIEL